MNDSKMRRDFVSSTVKSIPCSGIRDFFELVAATPGMIRLGVGGPAFPTPWHIRDSSIFALEKIITTYTSNLGLSRLRDSISTYVARHFGVEYDPEQEILVTTGVSEGLDLAVRAVTEPGDEILTRVIAGLRTYGSVRRGEVRAKDPTQFSLGQRPKYAGQTFSELKARVNVVGRPHPVCMVALTTSSTSNWAAYFGLIQT